ncbi:GCN5-related N-acetyltransferase [Xenorhabdus doucetiae]|uniref:GCN5-related N-acetyltransferase n=1 Tax=Xenorhabdus doucetiae TaxID=351671 RepID=A0A068QTK9_9GAMM|nr:GNAT family N-acetyltransferase [Xenorhabdus doucetiae]TYP06758.1 ribosomal protein S18 acetylase RimI-like enzyme [Xenorhabdus doucetiae]CDG18337.1 GCN5-related N-acetyltransferase [Xenorhabdus doucetiae]
MNTLFSIRLTQKSDVTQLPAIERSAAELFRFIPELDWIADGYVQTEPQHLGYITQGNSWIALNEGSLPIGFILAKPLDDGLHIVELSVHEHWQRKGIGKALIENVIQVAQQRQLNAVTLTTFRYVNWNAPFYHKLGFEILDSQQISESLQQILQSEIDDGFVEEQRCAMRRCLTI